MKIDTQGGEVEVFKGMEQTIAAGYVTCLSEFVPDAISTRVAAAGWLKRLSDRFLLFEIRGIDLYLSPSHQVTAIEAIDDFVEEVRGRKVPYTDLLMVPRDIPGVENLRRRIERLRNE